MSSAHGEEAGPRLVVEVRRGERFSAERVALMLLSLTSAAAASAWLFWLLD